MTHLNTATSAVGELNKSKDPNVKAIGRIIKDLAREVDKLRTEVNQLKRASR